MSTGQILGGDFFASGRTTGQRIGSVIGAVIGAVTGGPMGAIYGYQASAEIAGALDPVPAQKEHGAVSKHLSDGDGQA